MEEEKEAAGDVREYALYEATAVCLVDRDTRHPSRQLKRMRA